MPVQKERRRARAVLSSTNNTVTMEPGEALGIAAQIAVTLAGFAGVVVVFRREAVHEWSAVDKLRLRLLLANSILPLCLCMMGLLLLTIKPCHLESGDGAAPSHSSFFCSSPLR